MSKACVPCNSVAREPAEAHKPTEALPPPPCSAPPRAGLRGGAGPPRRWWRPLPSRRRARRGSARSTARGPQQRPARPALRLNFTWRGWRCRLAPACAWSAARRSWAGGRNGAHEWGCRCVHMCGVAHIGGVLCRASIDNNLAGAPAAAPTNLCAPGPCRPAAPLLVLSWDPQAGLALAWREGDVWSARTELPPGTLSFKASWRLPPLLCPLAQASLGSYAYCAGCYRGRGSHDQNLGAPACFPEQLPCTKSPALSP